MDYIEEEPRSEEQTRRIKKKRDLSETYTEDESGLRLLDFRVTNTQEAKGVSTVDDEGALERSKAPEQVPAFSSESIYKKLGTTYDGTVKEEQRYEIGNLLGKGGGGCVYKLRDHNMNRTVAVKVMPSQNAEHESLIKKFINEALIASQLDHPNILPVYDLDISDDGVVYYTMKRVEGVPLSVIGGDSEGLSITNNIDNIDEIINIFIKVGDAVSYAHSLDIVHQDIKPSNIMLGAYGEVRIVDWGTAVDLKREERRVGSLFGTPVYMSPEQSRREGADKSSDIYCLGSSLFHVLFKRFPVWRDDQEDFWIAKRKGIIDPLTDDEQRAVPAPLAAICFKCLASDPKDRYAHVEDLVQDLKNYQAGSTVNVYDYSIIELLGYWSRRNKQPLLWFAMVCLVICGAMLYAYQQHQRELAGWGEPVFIENFDDPDTWRDNFIVESGTYKVTEGRLVTVQGPAFFFYFNKRIQGPAAIEYEGEMLPGSPPCDLSVVYTNDIYDPKRSRYLLQNGAFANSCSMILGPKGRLDYSPNVLENGVRYKVRAEIDGEFIRLFLNDQLICSNQLDFPLSSGYIGVYGYYYDKAFDNIKVFSKNVPEVTGIIETGDLLHENGLLQQASERYEKISHSHPGTVIADEALYKQALCYYELGKPKEAFLIWDTLGHSEYAIDINFYRWAEMAKRGEYEGALTQMENLYERVTPQEKRKIQEKWATNMSAAVRDRRYDLIRRFLRFRRKHFPNDQIYGLEVMDALVAIGAGEEVVAMFPNQDMVMIRAMGSMGLHNEIVEKYPNMRDGCAYALNFAGRHQEVIKGYKDISHSYFDALVALGRIEEARTYFSKTESRTVNSNTQRLNELDMYQGVFNTDPEKNVDGLRGALRARLYSGDYQGFLDDFRELNKDKNDVSEQEFDARMCKALDRIIQGKADLEELDETLALASHSVAVSYTRMFTTYLLRDVLAHLNGDEEPLKVTLQKIWDERKRYMGMKLWHATGLILNHIERDEFMQQPTSMHAVSEFEFYKGLREELYGDKQRALKHYQTFKATPAHKRFRSVARNLYVDWRIAELSKSQD